MSVHVKTSDQKIGFGYRKQTDAFTAAVVGDIWCLNKSNADIPIGKHVNEDDADEFGKGHEFATTDYPSHVTVDNISLTKFLSSEIIAWAASFGLGNCVKTGVGPYVYTCTPLASDGGVELPYFSFVQQVVSDDYLDQMFVGCALDSFIVDIAFATPGRQSAKIELGIKGIGKITVPSGITLPTKTTEHELKKIGLAFTLLSVDYVDLLDLVRVRWGWQNQLTPRYVGGAAQDTNYETAGLLEYGKRQPVLEVTARVRPNGSERAALVGNTTGTAVLTQGTGNETYTATFQKVSIQGIDAEDDDGKYAIKLTCKPMMHATNGLLTVAATTAFNNICQAPA